jgi:hypothetical protein
MTKIKDNYTAELIILIVTVIMFLSSCGAIWQIDMVATCPAYAQGVTEAELGSDMYANQEWDKE